MIWVRECFKRHLSDKLEDVITNEGIEGNALSIVVGVTRRMYQIPVSWE